MFSIFFIDLQKILFIHFECLWSGLCPEHGVSYSIHLGGEVREVWGQDRVSLCSPVLIMEVLNITIVQRIVFNYMFGDLHAQGKKDLPKETMA